MRVEGFPFPGLGCRAVWNVLCSIALSEISGGEPSRCSRCRYIHMAPCPSATLSKPFEPRKGRRTCHTSRRERACSSTKNSTTGWVTAPFTCGQRQSHKMGSCERKSGKKAGISHHPPRRPARPWPMPRRPCPNRCSSDRAGPRSPGAPAVLCSARDRRRAAHSLKLQAVSLLQVQQRPPASRRAKVPSSAISVLPRLSCFRVRFCLSAC